MACGQVAEWPISMPSVPRAVQPRAPRWQPRHPCSHHPEDHPPGHLEPPTVKLFYLWLAQRGAVDLSQRQIAEVLGLTQSNVSIAIGRLRELGLVEYPSVARKKSRLRVLRSGAKRQL